MSEVPFVVTADDFLLRRLISSYHVIREGDGWRVSSGAFKDRRKRPDPECSVYLDGLETVDSVLALGKPYQGVAKFPARVPLSIDGMAIIPDPMYDAPGHCLMTGLNDERCAMIASVCTVERHPQPRPVMDVES